MPRMAKALPKGVVIHSGGWYVRVRYEGPDGKRHALWRRCEKNAVHARQIRRALEAEIEEERARWTFAAFLHQLFQR